MDLERVDLISCEEQQNIKSVRRSLGVYTDNADHMPVSVYLFQSPYTPHKQRKSHRQLGVSSHTQKRCPKSLKWCLKAAHLPKQTQALVPFLSPARVSPCAAEMCSLKEAIRKGHMSLNVPWTSLLPFSPSPILIRPEAFISQDDKLSSRVHFWGLKQAK